MALNQKVDWFQKPKFLKGDKIFFKNLLSSTGSFTPLWHSLATKG